MGFYFSVFQLLKSAELLERDLRSMASRAFRISPRDSRTNRDLLEKCATKAGELRGLLGNEFHLSKITLRHASLLYRLFQLSLLRIINLGNALSEPEKADKDGLEAARLLFPQALLHFRLLEKSLSGLTEIPQMLELERAEEDREPLLREERIRRELFNLVERAIKASREDHELLDSLNLIRSELLEARKILRRFSPLHHSAVRPPALASG